MRISSRFVAVTGLISVLCISSAGSAEDSKAPEGEQGTKSASRQQGGKRRPEFAAAMAQRMPLMAALDADKDGTLSASEIENAAKALMALDRNGDGILSSDELRPNPAEMIGAGFAGDRGKGQAVGAMMARMFENRDANGDGKLSGDEIPERMKRMLERVDENGDGAIDKTELEKMASKMGDRAGKRKPGEKDRDGAGVLPKRPAEES